ncbi:hypothetical protein AAB043_004728 [Vibrio alginolyticus]|uniref:hypothetical protein n=1 Tax=Vibrio alginolyticus TaxID=663 RepID=UPI002DD448A9|nr:hypothetical protein [Vibrio alginolyticus]
MSNHQIFLNIRVLVLHNALLRCEQRNTDAAAYHLNHLNQRMIKMPRVANHS